MLRMSAVYLCLAVAASALAGCAAAPPYPDQTVYWGTFPQQPPDYSPDYASVPVVDPKGRTRYVLVPRACLVPDPTSLRSWDRICRRAAPTHTTFSAWPSASPTWFAAARSAPPPRPDGASGAGIHLWHQGHPARRGWPSALAGHPSQGAGAQSETEKPPATR